MPVTYINDKGEKVKEGSNGCETCGFSSNNKVVLEPVLDIDLDKDQKKSKKEVSKDGA